MKHTQIFAAALTGALAFANASAAQTELTM
jgi:hypothetical protein